VVKRAVALLGACHPGPAFAVTLLAGLLAGAVGLGPGRVALVVAAVLTGQLSIGWSNDLVDLARDRAVGRVDKPLVDGRVSERAVRTACALAVAATVPLSLACGWGAGLVHLVCVAAGWAYNLGLKSTPWSWLPYAVAFGGLPVFVTAAVVIVVGAPVDSGVVAAAALLLTAGLAAVALLAHGRAPFRAAIAMALVDVAMLVWVR